MYTIHYFPPGREDSHIFAASEKPTVKLAELEAGLQMVIVFKPTNGPQRGTTVTVPFAHCMLGEDEH